jgi:hypothetical protein
MAHGGRQLPGGHAEDTLVLPGVGGAGQVFVHPGGTDRQRPAAQPPGRRADGRRNLGRQRHRRHLVRAGAGVEPGPGQGQRQRLGGQDLAVGHREPGAPELAEGGRLVARPGGVRQSDLVQ